MQYILNSNPSINYYLIFYLVGFFIAYLLIFYRIQKLNENKALLTSVTALVFLAFVFGCKLMPLLEYSLFPEQSVYLSHSNSQMAFGGMLMSLLVVLALRKLIKMPDDYWYSIGLAIIVGLFIQKPGCLLGGCCKGIETGHTFGVMYFDGILRHPLQLYEWLLYLTVLILIMKLRTRKSDSKYFLVVSLYCLIQFGMEFFRDPLDTIAFSFNLFGMKAMQWNYLILAMVGLYLTLKNEFRKRGVARYAEFSNSSYQVFLLIIVFLSFYLIRKQLFASEVIAINLAFVPAIFYTAVQAFQSITIPKYRWATLTSLLLPVLLMGQTMKENIEQKQQVYQSVKIGYHGGNYDNYVMKSPDLGSCTGPYFGTEFEQKYNTITIGYGITKVREKVEFSYGIDASFGKLTETDTRLNTSKDHVLAILTPYIQYDGKWVGIGGGLHLGSVYYPKTQASSKGHTYPESGLNFTPILPMANFRIGPKRIFFGEYNFANHFPNAIPGFTNEMAIGSGFGLRSGFQLKYGILFGSQSHYEVGRYVNAYIPIENRVVLEPLVGFGSMNNVYMLGVSYRFGHKETTYFPSNQ